MFGMPGSWCIPWLHGDLLLQGKFLLGLNFASISYEYQVITIWVFQFVPRAKICEACCTWGSSHEQSCYEDPLRIIRVCLLILVYINSFHCEQVCRILDCLPDSVHKFQSESKLCLFFVLKYRLLTCKFYDLLAKSKHCI